MSRLTRLHPPAPLAGSVPSPRSSPMPRLALVAAVAAAVAMALWLGGGPASQAAAGADPELANLLRFMVGMKGGMALGAALLVGWRLGHPIGGGLAAGFILAAAMAAAGPALMWHLTALGLGAALLYGGLLTVAALAWWDRAAILAALAAARAARR